jgi:hypothetical protein
MNGEIEKEFQQIMNDALEKAAEIKCSKLEFRMGLESMEELLSDRIEHATDDESSEEKETDSE